MSVEHHREEHGRHHHEHPHHHHFTIVVNLKEHRWIAEKISFEELVKLSGLPVPPGPLPGFTITYFNGPPEKPDGSVIENHSVKVHNHEVFSVTPTSKS